MKKFLFSLGVVCFSLIAVHISTAEIDLETAVGIWLFDEGKGNVAGDASVGGNDAELVKSPAWVKGKFGMALEFDGKASCVSTGQKLLDNLEEFTILTWVQTGDVNANRTGLVGQNDSPEFGFINPGAVMLWTPTAGGNENPYEHPPGEWHHVAAVATQEFTKVYIDGNPTTKNGNWPNHGRSDFNVNIGGCGVWDGTGNWFTGAMDEVGLFHAPLTDADIADVMNNGLTALGVAVEPAGKIAVTWGILKRKEY